VVREKKTHILNEHFSADLDRLADYAAELARTSWRTFDLSSLHLRRALALLTVELTVYRTYLGEGRVDPEDRALLERTFAAAASQGGDVDPAAFEFLKGVFLAEALGPAGRELVRRWQQLTPAVMAKGVEDTTFYCYDRLVACNEVGAQASLLGISSDKFHEFCHHLAGQWPETLLATSTHDTKRSEDVRARLGVLTEIPEAWGVTVREWSAMNRLPGILALPNAGRRLAAFAGTGLGLSPQGQSRGENQYVMACAQRGLRVCDRAVPEGHL
jgi:(1->4)-alpha-D-glucan 1-alpha-D-glucosylmutase